MSSVSLFLWYRERETEREGGIRGRAKGDTIGGRENGADLNTRCDMSELTPRCAAHVGGVGEQSASGP